MIEDEIYLIERETISDNIVNFIKQAIPSHIQQDILEIVRTSVRFYIQLTYLCYDLFNKKRTPLVDYLAEAMYSLHVAINAIDRATHKLTKRNLDCLFGGLILLFHAEELLSEIGYSKRELKAEIIKQYYKTVMNAVYEKLRERFVRDKIDYILALKHKSAMIFKLCGRLSGILAEAASKDVEKLEKALVHLGIALQIVDDLRDVEEDFDRGIMTLPMILAHVDLQDEINVISKRIFNQKILEECSLEMLNHLQCAKEILMTLEHLPLTYVFIRLIDETIEVQRKSINSLNHKYME